MTAASHRLPSAALCALALALGSGVAVADQGGVGPYADGPAAQAKAAKAAKAADVADGAVVAPSPAPALPKAAVVPVPAADDAPSPAAADDARLKAKRGDPKLLDDAATALADFDAERAVTLLEEAKTSGGWSWADHARLYEQLGVAYAYLEQPAPTAAAFDMLLAIDPARAISYTLSPKVTFLFEKARKASLEGRAPAIHVSWRTDLKVTEEVPIDVELVDDPRGFFARGVLGWRLKGSPRYETRSFAMPAAGQRHTELLPPAGSAKRESLEIYVAVLDPAGSEVLLWSSPARPREVVLDYDPPTPWYGKWWVWTIAGVAVAAGATAAAVAVTSEPGPTVPGSFQVGP
jgi:hypothetical protein